MGSSFRGDIAIDDIFISNKPCPPPGLLPSSFDFLSRGLCKSLPILFFVLFPSTSYPGFIIHYYLPYKILDMCNNSRHEAYVQLEDSGVEEGDAGSIAPNSVNLLEV